MVPPAAIMTRPVSPRGMPATVSASPRPASRAEAAIRSAGPLPPPSCGACSTAMGAVLDAAAAGSSAAADVTSTAISSDRATAVPVSETVPEFTAATRAVAAPIPAAPAASPIVADSARMPASSWRRVAPTQRSSAVSRSRWASRIRKLL